MLLLEEKRVQFLRFICLSTICFQIVFSMFYIQLPLYVQLILCSSIPCVAFSFLLLHRYSLFKASSFTYILSVFVQQWLTFYFLTQGPRINIGAALMMGTSCIVASVLLGLRWGLFFTALAVIIISSEIFLLNPLNGMERFSNVILFKNGYTFLSILQPGIIVNYLSYYFYHVLAQESKDKKEIKFRLEKVLENSVQSVVLIGQDRKVLYTDSKTKELTRQYLGLDLKEGEPSDRYIIAPHRVAFNENLDKAFLGEKRMLERRVELPNGSVLWFQVIYAPLFDSLGRIDCVQFSLIDISANKNVQEELQKAEERWKYALTSSQDGVWDWNVQDGKAFFSRTWKGMLGYEDNEIANSFSEWEKLVHPEDKQKAFEEMVKHIKNQTENYVLEHRLLQKNGSYKWILARGKIIERDTNGNPVRFIGTHTDINHIKKVEQDLKAAQEKAEQAAEAKSQFLSTISHEIRTPLNAVIGFSNLLLRENPDFNNSEYLQNIQTSANHLLSLVNNVLDISKIESGKIEFEKHEFDLEKLMAENIAILSLRAKEKNIDLRIGDIPSFSHTLIGDPFRLTQVLNNLLSNAVKFTDKGYVQLKIDHVSETDDALELKFSIKDTGAGIPSDKIDTIFESFAQASSDTTRKYGGTGLGLTISKHIINLQGGNIGVESKLHEGSTFYFNLNFAKGRALQRSTKKQTEEVEEPLTGFQVLVAEDNIFNIKVLTRFLELWGIEYDVAENGRETVDAASAKDFDLILMDLHMPKMDGYEATRLIREKGIQIHIIALTASANFSSKDEMVRMGFDDYAQKPINPSELYKKLRDVRSKVLQQAANEA